MPTIRCVAIYTYLHKYLISIPTTVHMSLEYSMQACLQKYQNPNHAFLNVNETSFICDIENILLRNVEGDCRCNRLNPNPNPTLKRVIHFMLTLNLIECSSTGDFHWRLNESSVAQFKR